MAGRLKLSAMLPVHGVRFADTLEAARAAERAGLDGAWLPDHLINAGAPRAGVLECWTALSAVAAVTERVPLGPLVLSTPFRHAPLLAKQAATLEALAPGRLVLGLGAGGFTYEQTCAQLGYAPLSPRERVEHVAETIECLRRLWGDDPASFEGRFAGADGARLHPRPARAIPIVVAASGPAMLALTARLADGWNCPLPQELERGIERIEKAGRARSSIEVGVFSIAVIGSSDAEARRSLERAGRTAQMFGDVEEHHVFGGPERAAERLRALRRSGADHVTLDVRGLPPAEAFDLLMREVAPALRGG